MDEDFDALKSPDPSFRVPDLSECIEGWRSWKVSGEIPPFGVAPKLHSAVQVGYWVPRRALEAVCSCRTNRKAEDGPPCEQGPCGLYSARTREHLLSLSYHFYSGEHGGMYCVIGRVANWGKIVECELGWRAQFSYPVSLEIPYEIWKLARPLQRAYGCKVELVNFLKQPGNAIA
jgi:hypothetical protein